MENEANLFLKEFLFNYISIEKYCLEEEEEKILFELAKLKDIK